MRRAVAFLLSLCLLPFASSARPHAQAPASVPKPTAPAATTAQKPTAAAPAGAAVRKPAVTTVAPPLTDDQKVIYALGLLMQQSIAQFDFSPAELAIIKRALTDGAAGKPALKAEEWRPRIQPLAMARGARVTAREKATAATYLATAAKEPGAVKTPSGLVYRDLRPGAGASPAASDTVRVHYRGTLTNGTEFDSSYTHNEPAEFRLNGVIGCWTEGVQRMKVGGKARLVCPSDLAYGDQGSPPIPGGATLIFEIELLDIVKRP